MITNTSPHGRQAIVKAQLADLQRRRLGLYDELAALELVGNRYRNMIYAIVETEAELNAKLARWQKKEK